MKKRLISLLLAIVLVLGLIPPMTAKAMTVELDDAVFVGNVKLDDGYYVLEGNTVSKKGTPPADADYAYFKGQTLYLRNFDITTYRDNQVEADKWVKCGIGMLQYASVYWNDAYVGGVINDFPLTIHLTGDNRITDSTAEYAIYACYEATLTVTGNGTLEMNRPMEVSAGTTVKSGKVRMAESGVSDKVPMIKTATFKMEGGELNMRAAYRNGMECAGFAMSSGNLDMTVLGNIQYTGTGLLCTGAVSLAGGTLKIQSDGYAVQCSSLSIQNGIENVKFISTAAPEQDSSYMAVDVSFVTLPTELRTVVSDHTDGSERSILPKNYTGNLEGKDYVECSEAVDLDFRNLNPAPTAAELETGFTDLGTVNLGSAETDIDFSAFPIDMPVGWKVGRSITVTHDGVEVYHQTYSDNELYGWNLKKNIDEGGSYVIALKIFAEKNGEVLEKTHSYRIHVRGSTIKTVTAEGIEIPVIGKTPSTISTVKTNTAGVAIVDVDWSYYSDWGGGTWFLMRDGQVFEEGKRYLVTVEFETLEGYSFPGNYADMNGYINGEKAMISPVYYINNCYVELEFEPVVAPANPFTDVKKGDFYYDPVMWAVQNGITTGATATTFNPGGNCLRAHVVTFLHRAEGNPEPTSTKNPFKDVKSSDFFYKPVLWAVEKAITNGTTPTTFGSYDNCNRAAVVTFLWRNAGSPEPKTTKNPFGDVKSTDFFYKAVLWAVEKGITNGVDATHFGPTTDCNRAQVVTFLYRAYN